MHYVVVKTGGRKFMCVQCEGVDPMRMSDIQNWINSELGRQYYRRLPIRFRMLPYFGSLVHQALKLLA